MYNQSITRRNLAKLLSKNDFKNRWSDKEAREEEILNEALLKYYSNDFIPETVCTILKNKNIFKMKNIGHDLLQRKMAHTFQSIGKVQIINRDVTIRRIHELLKDDTPYRVYRLDIKNFYETVDLGSFFAELCHGHIFTRKVCDASKKLLINPIHSGLPRGYALSSVLSEVILKGFDYKVLSEKDVVFYARFVDDILIITTGREDSDKFLKIIKNYLPYRLKLNKDKEKILPFIEPLAKGDFSYLGYHFDINTLPVTSRKERKVVLEISPKKIKKIKSRILLSFNEFNSEVERIDASTIEPVKQILRANCLLNLRDRIRFLTGNYRFIDHETGSERSAGLYFNYHLIQDGNINSLRELDSFLAGALRNNNNKIFVKTRALYRAYPDLHSGMNRIVGLSFYGSFKKVTFFHFNEQKLKKVQECWKYVT